MKTYRIEFKHIDNQCIPLNYFPLQITKIEAENEEIVIKKFYEEVVEDKNKYNEFLIIHIYDVDLYYTNDCDKNKKIKERIDYYEKENKKCI